MPASINWGRTGGRRAYTIAYNGASFNSGLLLDYGGLLACGGTATLDNTIVTLSTSGTGGSASDITGVVSGEYNLIGTGGSGGLTNGNNGNQVGVANPGLGLRGDGGPTDPPLLPGSPAIDAVATRWPSIHHWSAPDHRSRGPGLRPDRQRHRRHRRFEVQSTNHLVVTAQPPASVTAGTDFGFTVTAKDNSGNVIGPFDGTVTVALASNPGGAPWAAR